jgi:uncharacterized glyoxalase superfamily protein PhnB
MEQRVTPYLLYEDGEAAIEFLTKAFGFRVERQTTGAAGGLYAEREIAPGGGWIFLGQPPHSFRNPATVGRTSQVYVLVDDVDGHFARANAAGARIVEEPNDLPFGHRRYACAEPQGHEWSFAQPIEEVGSDG